MNKKYWSEFYSCLNKYMFGVDTKLYNYYLLFTLIISDNLQSYVISFEMISIKNIKAKAFVWWKNWNERANVMTCLSVTVVDLQMCVSSLKSSIEIKFNLLNGMMVHRIICNTPISNRLFDALFVCICVVCNFALGKSVLNFYCLLFAIYMLKYIR